MGEHGQPPGAHSPWEKPTVPDTGRFAIQGTIPDAAVATPSVLFHNVLF